jgi:hypothetical protein
MMKLVGWAQGIVTFRGGSSEMLSGVAFVFPRASGAGDDDFPAVPVHPAGSRLERAV